MLRSTLFRKRPVYVDAMKYDRKNGEDVANWLKERVIVAQNHVVVRTLSGNIYGDVGDYIIRGVDGDFSICNPDVFEKAYEPVEGVRSTPRMSFGEAFDFIRKYPGAYMRLPKWSPDVKIKVKRPETGSDMSAPYLYVESRFGTVPWKETMIELFSEEWEVGDKCGPYKH